MRRASAAQLWGGAGHGGAVISLAGIILIWWLAVAAVVAHTLSEPAASATREPFVVVVGRTVRIYQPGMPSWPIPVERAAFDRYQRGVRESDEDTIVKAFEISEWLQVSHGQLVLVTALEGDANHVPLLEGPHSGRRAWLKRGNLGPLGAQPAV